MQCEDSKDDFTLKMEVSDNEESEEPKKSKAETLSKESPLIKEENKQSPSKKAEKKKTTPKGGKGSKKDSKRQDALKDLSSKKLSPKTPKSSVHSFFGQ